VQNPNDSIEIPTHLKSDEVDYECELAVVIGKACKNVSRQDAIGNVLVTPAPMTYRRATADQARRRPMVPRQDVRHILPAGPCLVTADEIPNPNKLNISTT